VFRAQETINAAVARPIRLCADVGAPLFLGGALGLGFALARNPHQHFALARCFGLRSLEGCEAPPLPTSFRLLRCDPETGVGSNSQ
jgi:hypothetical protein